VCSQFFHSRRALSSHPNVRSTTHRCGNTTNVCGSFRFTTATSLRKGQGEYMTDAVYTIFARSIEMKKLFIICSFAFILFSCDNGTTGTGTDNTDKPANPFLGTWEEETLGEGVITNQIQFTEDEYLETFETQHDIYTYRYTYYYTETTLFFSNENFLGSANFYFINQNKLLISWIRGRDVIFIKK
jgi:hypothetical protein